MDSTLNIYEFEYFENDQNENFKLSDQNCPICLQNFQENNEKIVKTHENDPNASPVEIEK